MAYGAAKGDLTQAGKTADLPIRLLRKPTRPYRFSARAHWRLIAHLSLNHHSLAEENLEAFTEMLALYNLPQSRVTERQIHGIVGLSQKPTRAWLPDHHGGGRIYGIEVTLIIDEEAFVGNSVHMFAQVIDHFLGLTVHLNSFVQLVLISKNTGEELIRCPRRNGDLNLV